MRRPGRHLRSLRQARNRARLAASYSLGSTGATLLPQVVAIELTNHCNLSCVMCPHTTMTRPKGLMSEELFTQVIEEIRDYAELVYLYCTGESMIHKRWAEFTRQAHQAGLTTCLSTNGTLMDERAAHDLLTSGLDYLVIPLDGGVRSTYEKIRRGGDFDRLITNIRSLLHLQARLRSPTRISFQMVYMPENAREIDQFKNLFSRAERRHIDELRFKPLYDRHQRARDDMTRTQRPCFWLWNMATVYWDGEVPLCCMDVNTEHLLGDLRSAPLAEIWNSPALQRARLHHRRRELGAYDVCRRCDIPRLNYFTPLTTLGSAILTAPQARNLFALYERLFILPFRRYGSRSG